MQRLHAPGAAILLLEAWHSHKIKIGANAVPCRNIQDPRALALVLEQAEERLANDIHPDPYRREPLPLLTLANIRHSNR